MINGMTEGQYADWIAFSGMCDFDEEDCYEEDVDKAYISYVEEDCSGETIQEPKEVVGMFMEVLGSECVAYRRRFNDLYIILNKKLINSTEEEKIKFLKDNYKDLNMYYEDGNLDCPDYTDDRLKENLTKLINSID